MWKNSELKKKLVAKEKWKDEEYGDTFHNQK